MSLIPKNINFDDYWVNLSQTLDSVIRCEKVERKVWNDKFSDVYQLCVAQPEPLNERLYKETKQFLETHVNDILSRVRDAGDENMIVSYHYYWERYSKGSQYINALYSYLNQQYVKRKKPSCSDFIYGSIENNDSHLMEIGELAYSVWKNLLIAPIQKSLVAAILEEIHRDRLQASSLNHSVVHSVIHSFVVVDEHNKSRSELSLYRSTFEAPFLEKTSEYYCMKANEYVSSLSCCEYLEKAIQLINDEDLRCTKYIHPSSYKLARRKVEERISLDHLDMLHRECDTLVKQESQKDLKNIYTLLQPIRSVAPLCECLESHIKSTGLMMVSALTPDNVHQQFVEAMLELHSKYSHMVRTVFNNDQQFIAVLDKACASVINYKPTPKHYNKSPDLLVRYSDSLLRKSTKGLSEADVDEKLNASITVFKYLSDKDIYQSVYQRMLCKRLIYRLSASMDAEEAMINRLKQTCGYEFTNKLHRMFTDINISADLTEKFLADCHRSSDVLQHGVSILVLQAGSWPISSQKIPQFQLPYQLEHALHSFERFYEKKFSGRMLSWVHAYSTCELKLNYLSKPYVVTVGLYQMGILVQYNDGESYSAEDLRERTKLEEKDWNRHVLPLTESKILFEANNMLNLNKDYFNKRTKFKIMSHSVKETPQETEKIRYNTDEDRKWQIQAAIVRIMKSRKLLKHNLLIEEVIKQLKNRFNPSVSIIKKSIEALIEKQYVERTSVNKDEYSYIA